MDTGKVEWDGSKDENADEMEEDGPSWLRQAVSSSAGPGTAATEAGAANVRGERVTHLPTQACHHERLLSRCAL